ncbi:MAG: serine hydrolase [Phycisphaerae bacterium]|nr:serine hydrolase [Phycisphaerae bacterium]
MRLLGKMIALLSMSLCAEMVLGDGGDGLGMSLPQEQVQQVEDKVAAELAECDFISVGLVYEANTIFVGSYGDQADVNAVVSYRGANPVTATLCLQLLERGVIASLDDDIRRYSPTYADCLPDEFSETGLTFRHLLEHSSGLPRSHSDQQTPVWKNGKLNIRSVPGTAYATSDVGYAVLEDILSDATGSTLDELLAQYVSEPIGATSFAAVSPDDPNVSGVQCTITDMTGFLAHFLNGGYICGELIRTEAWEERLQDNKGLGWDILKEPDSDFAALAFTFATQGQQQVYMVCQPCGRLGAVLITQKRPPYCLTSPFQLLFDLHGIAGYRHSQDKGGPHSPQWEIP